MFSVYCHTSPSGKRYVGYTGGSVRQRWLEHQQEACGGSDRLVCRAIRKYGADSFRTEVLALCDTEAGARKTEQQWIAQRASKAPAGYNATDGGDGRRGFRTSDATKQKISAAKRGAPGRFLTPESRAKISASWSAERRASLSDRMRGNTFGVGKPASDKQRDAASKTWRGVKRGPFTAEHRAALSVARRERAARDMIVSTAHHTESLGN